MGLWMVRPAARALGFGLFVIGWTSLWVGVAMTVDRRINAPKIASSEQCAPGEADECFVEHSGVVDRYGGWHDLYVAYDDRRKTMGVSLRSDELPALGTRVRLQIWDSDPVAIYDDEEGRRYRTNFWPERWDANGIGAAAFGFVIVAIAATGRLVRRRRWDAAVVTPAAAPPAVRPPR